MAESKKLLIIMRGLPGSGKSTKAKALAENGAIFSTDDFWGPDYNFDASLLGTAHKWNEERAEKAMKASVTPIVIDNVNNAAYTMRTYVQNAIKYGYDVKFEESETPWRFDVDQLTSRNKHNVPRERIQDMLNAWEPDMSIEKALNSIAPWDKITEE